MKHKKRSTPKSHLYYVAKVLLYDYAGCSFSVYPICIKGLLGGHGISEKRLGAFTKDVYTPPVNLYFIAYKRYPQAWEEVKNQANNYINPHQFSSGRPFGFSSWKSLRRNSWKLAVMFVKTHTSRAMQSYNYRVSTALLPHLWMPQNFQILNIEF